VARTALVGIGPDCRRECICDLVYHTARPLSVVEVRLSVWQILDSSCGDYATTPVGLGCGWGRR
jgi:hypothetical protein